MEYVLPDIMFQFLKTRLVLMLKKHDEREKQNVNGDNEDADMFEISPTISSSEDIDTSS